MAKQTPRKGFDEWFDNNWPGNAVNPEKYCTEEQKNLMRRGWQACNAQSQELIAELTKFVEDVAYADKHQPCNIYKDHEFLLSMFLKLQEKAKSHLKQQKQE